MLTLLLTVLVVGLIIAGMSVGVIFANKPIKGSCGGMAALGVDTECDICGGDQTICETERAKSEEISRNKQESQNLAYEASQKERNETK